MPSTRESALQALHQALQTLTGPTVRRNAVVPERVPAGGLVVLRDGDPGEPDIVLSPTTYSYEHEVPVEILVQHASAADRDEALDNLLYQLPSALADPTLGGAVDFAEIRAPEILDGEDVIGAPDLKGAVVPVVLHYTTTHPLQ